MIWIDKIQVKIRFELELEGKLCRMGKRGKIQGTEAEAEGTKHVKQPASSIPNHHEKKGFWI